MEQQKQRRLSDWWDNRASLLMMLDKLTQEAKTFDRMRQKLLELYDFAPKSWKRLPMGQAKKWRQSKEKVYRSIGVEPRAWRTAHTAQQVILGLGAKPVEVEALDYFAYLTPKQTNQQTYCQLSDSL